jgi:hypothetical protein
MYPITFKDISSDEVEEYLALAIKSNGFSYAFLKETENNCVPENIYMQLFFTTEYNAILFELRNR